MLILNMNFPYILLILIMSSFILAKGSIDSSFCFVFWIISNSHWLLLSYLKDKRQFDLVVLRTDARSLSRI